MKIADNSRFFSLMLVALLSFPVIADRWSDEQYEDNTSCRSINNNEERIGANITNFNGKSVDVSRMIENRVDDSYYITSIRLQASPDTSSMARIIVNGRVSDWYYPKIYRDNGDYYTVYCFDSVSTRADSEIEIHFNSGQAKPRNLVLFVRDKY